MTDVRWVARLRPTASTTVDGLLHLPIGLDVWERGDDVLVVAAWEGDLADLERRHLARVERISRLDRLPEDNSTGGGAT
jgi:hypothetical protein